jgi:hypothetical protein
MPFGAQAVAQDLHDAICALVVERSPRLNARHRLRTMRTSSALDHARMVRKTRR